MCYDDKASPPHAPGAHSHAHGELLTLTASDGNQFHAYLALPESHTHTGIVIYPDIRGLFQFYKDLALRFAEAGIAAIAMDYFGRTAGLTSRDEPFEWQPHVAALKIDTITLDVNATLACLREKAGADLKVFVTGFCMGGSLTLITGTNRDLGLTGLIPFYSGMTRTFGESGNVLDNATKVVYPVVGFYGGDDQGIPQSAIDELDTKLDQAGVAHALKVYPGAPHSFFDRTAEQYADASSDAWTRLLAFIKTGTPQPA